MKICVITGSRAEYGLLRPLLQELTTDNYFDVSIIATGMHLSPDFGLTYKEIENDGFKITEKIEILLSSDSPVGVSKAMGLAMISFSEAYQRLKPDLLIGLGDRFELFSAVTAALVSKIPVAHIHGGEITQGAYDEGFRHAITKMSHVHFTSTETYRKRVIQLGENPDFVYNTGALGLDNINKLKLLSKHQLEKSIKFRLDAPYFIVTYHPVTLEKNTSKEIIEELLRAFEEFKSYKIIFTFPNADNDGRIIIKLITEYVNKNPERAIFYQSLGQLRYLSVLKYSEMMIGNSSSGIIEMPFFRKPTINIGDRQKGRVFPESVLQTSPNKDSIVDCINKALSTRFLHTFEKRSSIYGTGEAAVKIKKVLLKLKLKNIVKKEFQDLHSDLND